jgi:hypothetical protein
VNPALVAKCESAFTTTFDRYDVRDLAPEGLAFVPASASWTGRPLLFVAHEADQPGGPLQTRTSNLRVGDAALTS